MIAIQELAIPEVKILTPKLHRDDRGYLAEVAQEKQMQEFGLPTFVQENQSLSYRKGTLRGLHAQKAPHEQAKLVRVLCGKIFDVAVDIRSGSPTYGKHVSATLSADDVTQMFVPAGFLHGFCTLEDKTVVLYKISGFYAQASEIGVIWDDPDLNIAWPIGKGGAILSAKDAGLPRFKDLHK